MAEDWRQVDCPATWHLCVCSYGFISSSDLSMHPWEQGAIWIPQHWLTAPPLVSWIWSVQSSSVVLRHQSLQPALWKEAREEDFTKGSWIKSYIIRANWHSVMLLQLLIPVATRWLVWWKVCLSNNIYKNTITIITRSNKHYFPCCCMCQSKEAPPFPALLCLFSEPLLALLIIQSDEVPVVVNQKILGKISRTDSVFFKQIKTKADSFFKTGFYQYLDADCVAIFEVKWCSQ